MPRSPVTLQESYDWFIENARHYIRLCGVMGMNVLSFVFSSTSFDASQHSYQLFCSLFMPVWPAQSTA